MFTKLITSLGENCIFNIFTTNKRLKIHRLSNIRYIPAIKVQVKLCDLKIYSFLKNISGVVCFTCL